MIDKKIMQEVMSQHFKIGDDLTLDNIESALDNYSDRLASKIALKQVVMQRFSDSKPPVHKTVLFVWWHRNGFETSQKTLGYLDDEGKLILDFNPAGGKQPTFWSELNVA